MLILIHVISSIVALILGSIILMKTKGTRFHKIIGWIFVVCMAFSAISSFGIYNNNFSVIHLLSLLVIIRLSMAIYATRFKPKNWLYTHASGTSAAYIAIIIAGVGVLVRKILLPGNDTAGYIASGIVAIVLTIFFNVMINKYKK